MFLYLRHIPPHNVWFKHHLLNSQTFPLLITFSTSFLPQEQQVRPALADGRAGYSECVQWTHRSLQQEVPGLLQQPEEWLQTQEWQRRGQQRQRLQENIQAQGVARTAGPGVHQPVQVQARQTYWKVNPIETSAGIFATW